MEKWLNKIIQGDALEVLKKMPSESVDMIITSPPYYGLRSYKEAETIWGGDEDCEHKWKTERTARPNQGGGKGHLQDANKGSFAVDNEDRATYSNFCQKCSAWKGQLGLEPTLDLYLEHILWIAKELKRVLKPKGTLWWNHGDSYGTTSGGTQQLAEGEEKTQYGKLEYKAEKFATNQKMLNKGVPQKSLTLQNFRLVQRMIDEQGWTLRNVIIWHKPNCMPSSAKDRFTVDFEPVFFFSKEKQYYFEQQFEPLESGEPWSRNSSKGGIQDKNNPRANYPHNPQGRNKRTVWKIPTASFPEAHFAVYPEELITTPIQAGCPKEICKKCGKARERIVETVTEKFNPREDEKYSGGSDFMSQKTTLRSKTKTVKKGYTNCGCNAGFKPGVVLDPFMGAGTTAVVALKQDKRFIGIELSPEYIEIAEKRIEPLLRQDKLF